jgi:predicted peptidase
MLGAIACAWSCTSTPPFSETDVLGPRLKLVWGGQETYDFYLYLPPSYGETDSQYPLLVFLHGAGEIGPIGPSVLLHGPLAPLHASDGTFDPAGLDALDERVKSSIVVVPRVSDPSGYGPHGIWNAPSLDVLIGHLRSTYRVDPSRIYLTGLSMGGGGTWVYASQRPGVVAAIIPICNGLDDRSPRALANLRGLPVWAFHSFDDGLVPLQSSRTIIEALIPGSVDVMAGYPYGQGMTSRAADGDYTISYGAGGLGPWDKGVVPPSGSITYTIYATGGHDAWTRTYANPDVWRWLYSQSQ